MHSRFNTLLPYTPLFRSDLRHEERLDRARGARGGVAGRDERDALRAHVSLALERADGGRRPDRKSTRLNSSHVENSYAVFCLKKKTLNSIRNHLDPQSQ